VFDRITGHLELLIELGVIFILLLEFFLHLFDLSLEFAFLFVESFITREGCCELTLKLFLNAFKLFFEGINLFRLLP